jgi:hypothetical protein
LAERESDVRVRSRFEDREAAALRADLDLTRTSEKIAPKRSKAESDRRCAKGEGMMGFVLGVLLVAMFFAVLVVGLGSTAWGAWRALKDGQIGRYGRSTEPFEYWAIVSGMGFVGCGFVWGLARVVWIFAQARAHS